MSRVWPPVEDRLWSRVEKTEGCWIWQGPPSFGGLYGQIHFEGRIRPAHVVSWTLTHGPVPAGLELDHFCRNGMCIRPDHLEPVTHAENMRRSGPAQAVRDRGFRCKRHDEVMTPAGSKQKRRCPTCHRESNRRSAAGHVDRIETTINGLDVILPADEALPEPPDDVELVAEAETAPLGLVS